MNRSYSKIRHIQESNLRLERRLISEQQDPNITQLVNKLKELPAYQDAENIRVDGNRVYYTGNINSTTVMNKQGQEDKKKSQIGTFVKASDPNARFFEWSGTGWKRGEQNKYYDQTPVDLATATTNFAKLSLSTQNQNQNIAKN